MTRETVAFLLSKKRKRITFLSRVVRKKERLIHQTTLLKRPAHASSCLLLLILRVLLSLG